MNADEIQYWTEAKVPRGFHIITISRDQLPSVNTRTLHPLTPLIIIINTSDFSHVGVHWAVFYVFRNLRGEVRGIFFDSYGKKHTFYGFKPNFIVSRSSYRSIQAASSETCGYFCVYFAFCITDGSCHGGSQFTFKKFYSHFSKNKKRNDSIVTKFVKRKLDIRPVRRSNRYVFCRHHCNIRKKQALRWHKNEARRAN